MTDTPPDLTPSSKRAGTVARLLIVGLPFGLLVMGALSFIFYFRNLEKKEIPESSHLAAMLRRDLNAEDFERYMRIFTDEISRSAYPPGEKRAMAGTFIESSMGFENMGYQIIKSEHRTADDALLTDLMVELKGGKNAGKVLLVATCYDFAYDQPELLIRQAAGVAAMLGVAQHMTSEPRFRTIRFAAFANREGLEEILDRDDMKGAVLILISAGSDDPPWPTDAAMGAEIWTVPAEQLAKTETSRWELARGLLRLIELKSTTP